MPAPKDQNFVSNTAGGAMAGSKFGPWGALIGAGVGLLNGMQQGQQQERQNQMADEDRMIERQRYNERAPWRQAALNGINAANQPVNSQSLFQSKANPFAANFDYSQDLGAGRMPDVDITQGQSSPYSDARMAYEMAYSRAPEWARKGMKPPNVMFPDEQASRDAMAQEQFLRTIHSRFTNAMRGR